MKKIDSARPFDVDASKKRCLQKRKRILDMSQKISALHIGSAYSCMEIVDTIYHGLMRKQDTFLMSKGHGCLAQYTALEEIGVLTKQDLDLYCKPEGKLGTHPDYGLPGIEASTGSLGHGMALSVGMALSDKEQKLDRVIYTVFSDGELQEGSIWEAVLLAPSLGIKNIVGFIDLNDFQSLGRTSEYLPNVYPVVEKFLAFGWDSIQVEGHDVQKLHEAVLNRNPEKSMMVIAKTTKGKGVSYMENVPIWHYRSPNPEEYQIALKELDGGLKNAK